MDKVLEAESWSLNISRVVTYHIVAQLHPCLLLWRLMPCISDEYALIEQDLDLAIAAISALFE